MGSYNVEGESQIPYIDFPKELLESEQGSEEWKALCGKVREACEEYGCFTVGYDGVVPAKQREEMFIAMKDLFDLPFETKQKNLTLLPNRGYVGSSVVVPLYESLAVADAHSLEVAQTFTDLMWSGGNPAVCQTMNNMSRKMQELEILIQRMILESYGVPTYLDAIVESTSTLFRMMKYRPPPTSDEAALGLIEHTDISYLTILCQEQVKGFEFLSKKGHWLQLSPLQQGSFLVIVGDISKVWSNGRLHALEHRVVMRGDKERYSYALFTAPKDEEVIEVAREFVDDQHPLLFRPFNFVDFVKYYYNSNLNKNALHMYAGI